MVDLARHTKQYVIVILTIEEYLPSSPPLLYETQLLLNSSCVFHLDLLKSLLLPR
jgi:hypothetical protein